LSGDVVVEALSRPQYRHHVVIEVFAPRFLQKPAMLFVGESGNKVVARDDNLARAIGLNIQADKNLPDTILIDLGPAHPLLLFVEAMATDGRVTPRSVDSDVRFGSLADITAWRHVRFTPDSGHSSVRVGCPKSANIGSLARNA
jgi:hypothetical protein